MKSEILVIDDNVDIRFLICNILKDNSYIVRSAANFAQAEYEIKKKLPDLAIIDIKLDKGDRDGIELLKMIMKINKLIPTIMISGHANVQLAVEAIRLGAYEFLEKPFSTEKILNYVYRALERSFLKNEKNKLENKLFHSFDLIGESPEIVKIKKVIDKLSSTDSRVLISGPTGSGKELVARKIHKNSLRSEFPFIVLNSALLHEKKYEKELFGEEYTNGDVSFGILEKANKGTLLIDQVSEIPLDIQSKILRVLIDQKFKRINGNTDINVDVRLICSSSKNLKNEIELGNFREDLYHRLNVFEINIEPLNQRISDIPLLIKYFSTKISENYNIKELKIDDSNSYLLNYLWPGNVRELRNMIERIAILQPDTKDKVANIIKESIKTDNLSDKITENSLSVPLKEAREKFEKEYLTIQLKKFKGNISKTANFVGMERSALHRKLKGLGIKEFN